MPGFLTLLGSGQKPAAASGPATATYIGTSTLDVNLTSVTFSSVNIGTAASDRLVVCAVTCYATAGETTSMTYNTGGGATSMTKVVEATGSSQPAIIFQALVTSGTTATFVLNCTGSFNLGFVMMDVWNVNGANTGVTPSGANIATSPFAYGSASLALTVPTNGVGIFCVRSSGNGTTDALSNSTIAARTTLAANDKIEIAAYRTSSGAATSVSSNDGGATQGAAAAWGP